MKHYRGNKLMCTPVFRLAAVALCLIALTIPIGCAKGKPKVKTVKAFPVDSLDGLISKSNVALDTNVTSDGNGSLKLTATESGVFRLYEIPAPSVDAVQLTYRAKIRTENLNGSAYLEMWCRFHDKGEFFSRALDQPLSGTTDWTSQETRFVLRPGQSPNLIRLNIAIEGSGTVWVDDIVVEKTPLVVRK